MSEITDLVPQEGFLADYVAYARRHAMAPDQFHLACGLAALSAIAGSALWFPMGISRFYGTFWGVLCGPAGRARKTSAMKLSMDLVDSVIPELQLPADFSREALLQLLEKQPSGVMMIDEFGGFLARASRDYMSGVKQDLSKMWDSPGVLSRVTMKAKYRIERPTLTIMAACPLEDFTNFARFSDFKQGFISRLLFFTMGQEDDLTYIDPGDVDLIAREYLIVQLRELAKLRANPKPVVVSESIRQQWREYDEKAAIEAAQAPPELSGWESRRGIWIAKLGLLFSLARTGEPVMDEEELARADWLVDILTKSMRELVLDVPLAGDRGAEKRRLIADRAKALARSGEGVVVRRDLFRSVQRHVDSAVELDRVMGVLLEAGEYEKGRYRAGDRGPLAAAFRLLNGRPPPDGWRSEHEKPTTNLRGIPVSEPVTEGGTGDE